MLKKIVNVLFTMKTIVVAISTLLICSLMLYFYVFHYGLSKETGDWANFAVFHGYFINIGTLMLIGYISFLTYKTTNRFNQLQHLPILFFTSEQSKLLPDHSFNTYYIRNGSSASALNVIVRYRISREGSFSKWVSCTPIAPDSALEIPWVNYPDTIQVCYSDFTAENYFLYHYEDFVGKNQNLSSKDFDKI